MEFMKKFGRGLSSSVLKLSLFSLAIFSAMVMVYGNPAQLKQTLKDSVVYDTVVNNLIEANASSEGDNAPLSRPEVKAAINKSASPAFVQSNVEQIIDSSYRWLNSESTTPDFKVDLTPVKQAVAEAYASYAVQRAQGLPTCNLQQLRALVAQGNNIDPFDAACIPPGFSLETLRKEVLRQVSSNDGFLNDPIISVDTLPKNQQGETVFEQYDYAPKIFNILKLAPYIFGSLAVLSVAGLILLSEERRRALRTIAITFIGTSVFLFISTWVLGYLFAQMNKPGGILGKAAGSNQSEQTVIAVIRSLNNMVNQKVLIFCAIYLVIGLGLLLIMKFTGPKEPTGVVATGEPEPAVTEVPTEKPGEPKIEVSKGPETK